MELIKQQQNLKEWLESLIDEEHYNPLGWVDYNDDPRYAADKTIKQVLERLG